MWFFFQIKLFFHDLRVFYKTPANVLKEQSNAVSKQIDNQNGETEKKYNHLTQLGENNAQHSRAWIDLEKSENTFPGGIDTGLHGDCYSVKSTNVKNNFMKHHSDR